MRYKIDTVIFPRNGTNIYIYILRFDVTSKIFYFKAIAIKGKKDIGRCDETFSGLIRN